MGQADPNIRKDISYSAVNSGKEKVELEEADLKSVPTIGVRHFQCIWLFIFIFAAYGTRVSLSVAIVAMTDPSASVNSEIPTYPEWTQKGAILSAFFWGYIWPQAFVGYVVNTFGAKWFLIGTMGFQSLLGIFTPFAAAQFGEIGVMMVRAIQGFCQGFFVPTVTHLLSHWAPREERATLTSIAFAAVPAGTITALIITGMIAASSYGWPVVFYMYGVIGIIWCVLFSFFGYNSPADHPSISRAEKYYIEKSLGHTHEKPKHAIPWKGIFTSKPVWALLAAQFGTIFGFWVLLSQTPTYMNYVMNFNIKDNSMLSALPYVLQLILSFVVGILSDLVINKKILSQTASRKLFNTMGSWLPAISLVLLAYTKGNEPTRAVILLMFSVGTMAAAVSAGWGLNSMDLSSNHSGTLTGLCNSVAHISAVFAPLMVQMLVKDQTDPEQWKIIFFIAAGIYIATSLIFVIWGSAVTQPWNEDQEENKDKEKQ